MIELQKERQKEIKSQNEGSMPLTGHYTTILRIVRLRKGGGRMKRLVTLEIPEGRLAEIFDRLHKAEQEISDCYNELRYLGVVTIQKAPSQKDDAPEN